MNNAIIWVPLIILNAYFMIDNFKSNRPFLAAISLTGTAFCLFNLFKIIVK